MQSRDSAISVTTRLYVEPELFEITDGGDAILYAPLKGLVLRSNRSLVNLLCDIRDGCPVKLPVHGGILQRLIALGVVATAPHAGNASAEPQIDVGAPFRPLSHTLFLTSDCNLACRYCYGGGGDRRARMPRHIALAAIELLAQHARDAGATKVNVGFHGGGEPLLHFQLMHEVVEYARHLFRAEGVQLGLSLTTNGAMPPVVAEWVADNIDSLNVSIDGPPEIQDYQRPLKGGGPSYPLVERALDYFDSKRKRYHFRTTVTKFSESRIQETVDYLSTRFSPASIQVEPMFTSPRAKRTGLESPDPHVFVRGFLAGSRILQDRRVELRFSGLRFPRRSGAFCGIGWKNLAVTPEGNVTACFEVLGEDDPRSEDFLFGSYVEGNGFVLDRARISRIRAISSAKPAPCGDCFAQHHCAGDCRAKHTSVSGEGRVPNSDRCHITQELTKARIVRQLACRRGDHHGRRASAQPETT